MSTSMKSRRLWIVPGHRHKIPKEKRTYKTSKRISLLCVLWTRKKSEQNLDATQERIITNEPRKKKSRTEEEGQAGRKRRRKRRRKPKKFQFIHSLNKYNIRYGVFMYIIHFQRNAHSTHGLWCEKSLWGFQAPHGARFIDCTLFRNESSVRANKWEPKKNPSSGEGTTTRRRASRAEEKN